jgi:hypothetical protein
MYVCPAGRTAIVKTIHVSNASGSANSVIVAASSGPLFVNVHISSLTGGSGLVQLEPYLVLEPGDELVLNSNQTNGANYWVSGVELDGVAP